MMSPLLKSNCLQCNSTFSYRLTNSTGQYCSVQCQRDRNYATYIEKWLLGEIDGARGKMQVSNYIRRWLFEKHNNSCEICGWSKINEWTNRVPLQVSHKNGDWSDHRPENLELVCPNCHSLTEFHGSRNKGRGRYAKTGKQHPYYTGTDPK
jgi:hypothetical protein